jgi:hypothetical protein
MTEFMDQTRLGEIAHVTDQPTLLPGRLIPRLTWTVDVKTGRPVGHWGLGEEGGARSACT